MLSATVKTASWGSSAACGHMTILHRGLSSWFSSDMSQCQSFSSVNTAKHTRQKSTSSDVSCHTHGCSNLCSPCRKDSSAVLWPNRQADGRALGRHKCWGNSRMDSALNKCTVKAPSEVSKGHFQSGSEAKGGKTNDSWPATWGQTTLHSRGKFVWIMPIASLLMAQDGQGEEAWPGGFQIFPIPILQSPHCSMTKNTKKLKCYKSMLWQLATVASQSGQTSESSALALAVHSRHNITRAQRCNSKLWHSGSAMGNHPLFGHCFFSPWSAKNISDGQEMDLITGLLPVMSPLSSFSVLLLRAFLFWWRKALEQMTLDLPVFSWDAPQGWVILRCQSQIPGHWWSALASSGKMTHCMTVMHHGLPWWEPLEQHRQTLVVDWPQLFLQFVEQVSGSDIQSGCPFAEGGAWSNITSHGPLLCTGRRFPYQTQPICDKTCVQFPSHHLLTLHLPQHMWLDCCKIVNDTIQVAMALTTHWLLVLLSKFHPTLNASVACKRFVFCLSFLMIVCTCCLCQFLFFLFSCFFVSCFASVTCHWSNWKQATKNTFFVFRFSIG